MMFSRFLLSACVLLLAGCAGNATAPSLFLLDNGQPAEPIRAASTATPVVVIDTVAVAPYLDASGIVYQTKPHQVVLANNNRWASPLPAQLTDGLYTALQARLGRVSIQRPARNAPADALHLVTRVEQFMGHYDGHAHIAGEWQLVGAAGTPLASGRIDQQVALDNDGYNALVEALSSGWQAAAEGMAPALGDALDER
jgi:hypothetical protein